jgi:GNAT superfamily N-acetyltransferase
VRDLSFTVRRATSEDARAIAEVHVASWRTTYPGIVDQAYIDGLSVDERAAVWARRLETQDESKPDVLVALTPESGVVGFASGGVIRHPYIDFDAELHAIYLLKPFQGLGLGRRLVQEWSIKALERGLHAAIVRVLADNPACAFYEKLGAELVRESQLEIAGKSYPEQWYAWRNLRDLAA